jgi:hypothetical protein
MDNQDGGASIHSRTGAGVSSRSSSSRTTIGTDTPPNSCGKMSIWAMSTR